MNPISTKELSLYQGKKEITDEGPSLPLSEHLNELRKKIIISLAVFLICALITFSFSKDFLRLLILAVPSETTFLQIKPGEFFFTSLRVALFFAFIFSSPIIIWQLGSFILPGLTNKEKKIAVPILTLSPLLFLTGSAFSYFFVIKSMLNFLFFFGKDVIPISISIEYYVSFVLMILAICGFIFLLPIVIIALGSAHIVSAQTLIKKWKHALLLSLILAAIFTPTPDPINMCLVGSILIALYLVSIVILKLMLK